MLYSNLEDKVLIDNRGTVMNIAMLHDSFRMAVPGELNRHNTS